MLEERTHVALELRLTAAEAMSLETWLTKFHAMASRKVICVSDEEAEILLPAILRIVACLAEKQPPFED